MGNNFVFRLSGFRHKLRDEYMNKLPRSACRWISAVSAFVLLGLVVSCAHEKLYSGPTLPDDQLATLEATTPTWLVSVDGHHISSFGLRDTVRVKILPGPHKVEVGYSSMEARTGVDQYGNFAPVRQQTWSQRNYPINFSARAGYRYVAHPGRIGASDWEPYVTESLPIANSASKK